MSAAQDRELYVKAMVQGNLSRCIQIEQKYDLFGYPPELVCIGLSAAVEGKDVHQVIEAYTRSGEHA